MESRLQIYSSAFHEESYFIERHLRQKNYTREPVLFSFSSVDALSEVSNKLDKKETLMNIYQLWTVALKTCH